MSPRMTLRTVLYSSAAIDADELRAIDEGIMTKARTFNSTATPRKQKGNRGEVNCINIPNEIVAGIEEGMKQEDEIKKKEEES